MPRGDAGHLNIEGGLRQTPWERARPRALSSGQKPFGENAAREDARAPRRTQREDARAARRKRHE